MHNAFLTTIIMDITKELFPKSNELVFRKSTNSFTALCVDLELDPFMVDFDEDGTITIETSHVDYLMLDADTLKTIIKLQKKTDKLYNNKTK